MRYIRIETDDHETRWINLDQVARVTLARHTSNGHPILVMFFASDQDECTLKIDGATSKNAAAIKALIAALDASSM